MEHSTMYEYEYPRPALTADIVVFSNDPTGHPTLLLIRRKNQPFAGRWALPGGFVDEGETAEEAARRELKEETSLNARGKQMTAVGLYDTPGRDPRGWTVSAAYAMRVAGEPTAIAQDDASEVQWHRLDSLPQLAFDHAQIIADAVKATHIN